jgi:hypothetical protein
LSFASQHALYLRAEPHGHGLEHPRIGQAVALTGRGGLRVACGQRRENAQRIPPVPLVHVATRTEAPAQQQLSGKAEAGEQIRCQSIVGTVTQETSKLSDVVGIRLRHRARV